jgi:CHAT domain-containing protein
VLVPVPDLHDIPWRLVLGVDAPLTVAPSASTWDRAAQDATSSADRVVAVAGPGLPGALTEARRVAALYPTAELLTGELATVERVGRSLDGAALAHLAAHATVRPSSPLFSNLLLADGPATAHDLDSLQHAPRIMVLSACSAAQAAPRSAGEFLGLSTVLLNAGTKCMIAPTIPIPDQTSVDIVVAFHRRVCAGATTAEAVMAAATGLNTDDPAGLVSACTLTCFGRGDVRLQEVRALRGRTRA